MLVLFVILVMVALQAPTAQASPPLGQDASGKYECYGPYETRPDGEERQPVYTDLSKKEAEEGLATGAYTQCSNKIIERAEALHPGLAPEPTLF